MNYDTQPIADVMDEAITKLNKMKKSQKQQIREYLENGGKLTFLAALNFYDCANLRGRIFEIREDYHDEWYAKKGNKEPLKEIKTEMIKTKSGKRIAQYSIEKLA